MSKADIGFGLARSLFDLVDDKSLDTVMDLSRVPDVPQVPLERYTPPRGRPANLDSILIPENAARLEEIAKRGEQMGGREWYNLEPLRMAFLEELGPSGDDAFSRYVDYVAATSPRSTVASNIRRGSHFYQLDRNGMPVGGLTNADMPKGYGHIAHNTHDNKLREIEEHGGLLPMQGPKVSSFAENLKGNQTPMTIDTHNFSAVRNDPGNKVSPTKTQYKYLEEYQAEIADKLGMTPAQFQASVWMAGDTGVADARPFMAVFDDVLTNTAERDGKSRAEALKDFINGNAPLYGLASVMAGGSLMMPSGEAEASEAPTMGWREWPTMEEPVPTSPAERGFRPWSDYEPEPSYMDRVTDPATYADALAPYARGINSLIQSPVGQYIGGRVSDVMKDYDSVGGGARGFGRGAYGLLSGESPSQALDAGIRVSNQTPAESGEAVERWAIDKGWHEEDAEALGVFTEFLTNPLDYAGLGILGRTVKGAM